MTANSLTLSWTASVGSPPISYQPQFRVTGATNWIPFGPILLSSVLTAIVTGLTASTAYDFEVVAFNPAGSVTSLVVSGSTSSGNAFPAAGNVAGSQNTGSAAPVIAGPQNASVTVLVALAIAGITITDIAAPGTAALVVSCTSGKLAMTLSGAAVSGSGTASITLSDTLARCQAAVATLIYTAPATPLTDTISVTLTDQVANTNTLLIPILVAVVGAVIAPGAPGNLTASAPTNLSMQLNWTASTGTAPISYQPQSKLPASGTYTNCALATFGLTAVVSGLTAGITYNFIVQATNSAGTTPSAAVTTSTTAATIAPSAPANLQVQSTTSASLTYSWSIPATGSLPISYQPWYRMTAAASGTRRYQDHPGGNGSSWNTSFGVGATWSQASDLDTIDISRGWNGSAYIAGPVGIINAPSNFGNVVYVSSLSDSSYTFNIQNNSAPPYGTITLRFRVPTGALTPGPAGGDSSIVVYDPIDNPGFAFSAGPLAGLTTAPGFQPGGGPFSALLGGKEDATSDQWGEDYDTGHSGSDLAVGMITGFDADPARNPSYPKVKHRLRYSIDAHLLKENGVIAGQQTVKSDSWPIRLQDGQSGINIYTGNLLAGATLGIPALTAMPGGLNANQQGLFWTLQNYGCGFRDQAGGGFHLCCDQVAYPSQLITDWLAVLPQMVGLLRVLRNQHIGGQSFVTNPKNGPGARMDPGPPPLTSVVVPNPFRTFGLPIDTTFVTITNLASNTSYDLEVTAINAIGSTTSTAVTSSTGQFGIPTDVTGTVARPAQDMLNRFGINTHFGNGLYAAFTPAQAVTALQSIGVTLVRDSENG